MKIILNGSYLNWVIQYIEHNPVTAKIVNNISSYKWSSIHLRKKSDYFGFTFLSWEKISINNNDRIPQLNELYIGNKDEYISLEKRKIASQYFNGKDNRKNEEISNFVKKYIKNSIISLGDLCGKKRNPAVVNLRKKICVELYNNGFSPSKIGLFFNRTRSIVFSAIQEIKNKRTIRTLRP